VLVNFVTSIVPKVYEPFLSAGRYAVNTGSANDDLAFSKNVFWGPGLTKSKKEL
jgi:hypothetical protein